VGYDRQINPNIILGVFADYAFGDLKRTETLGGMARIKSDIGNNNWAVGARLGFVHSCCTMWYVNAGYTQADHEWSLGTPWGEIGDDKTLDGYFVGGG